MDQIANLVIDLSLDAQEFKDEVPRVKKMLEDASDKAEISAQRQKNLIELLQKQGRAYIGGHEHTMYIGPHGHVVIVDADGNAETTVKNIAFNYIVRLA